MKEHINTDSKSSEIKLLLSHPSYRNKVVVLIEGKTDSKLYGGLFDLTYAKLENVVGKASLADTLNDLVSSSNYSKKVIGVCDADFLHITGEEIGDNLFLTDVHDIEMMIINSPAVNSMILEHAKHESIYELKENLVDEVLRAAYDVGLIRLLNYQQKLNLNFRGIAIGNITTVNDLKITIDISGLLDNLIARSNRLPSFADKDYLLKEYEQLKKQEYDVLHLCCGHDVTKIIACVLRQEKYSDGGQVGFDNIESSLRVGYTLEYFKQTILHSSLLDWQQLNSTPQFLLS